jgi:L-lactate utilization protein LutC
VTPRDQILSDIRRALGRTENSAIGPLAAPMLRFPKVDAGIALTLFLQKLEKLNGKGMVVPSKAAVVPAIRPLLDGKRVVAANAPFLASCGINELPGVQSGIQDRDRLREICASADIGISSVDYALAETGSFVMLAGPENPRLISLLPPVHIAVFPCSRLLASLDELLSLLPAPAEQTSSMVLITGPSRTADIEQILVRGVHGPGEVYAVIVEDE